MSSNPKLKIKIDKIISDTFNVNNIEEDHTPDDIEDWDSLGQLKLINNLEEELGILFTMEEIFQILAIKDIYKIIQKKLE